MRRIAMLLALLVGVAAAPAVTTSPAQAYTPTVKPTSRTIAAGESHTLVVGGDGKVYGSGSNAAGQLTGAGPRTTLTALTGLPSGVRATAVSAGVDFSIVLGSNGKVYGTGLNDRGQLTGAGSRSTLTPLTGLPAGVGAKAVAAGSYFTLVLGSNGKVYGTGEGNGGELTGVADRTTLTPLTGGPTTATSIAAGQAHTVVLGSDGKVYGTGNNTVRQLTGTADPKTTLTSFVDMPAGTKTAIDAGSRSTYFLGANQYAYSLGGNGTGQLGDGTYDMRAVPYRLASVDDVVSIAGGVGQFVIADSSGAAYGVGDNVWGQLTGAQSFWTSLVGLAEADAGPRPGRIVEVASGEDMTLVRDSNGLVFGAGFNLNSQLTGVDARQKRSLTILTGQKIVTYVKPTVSGTMKQGRTVRAYVGSWSVRPSAYTYRWLRNGVNISGAVSSTYTLKSVDKGKRISIRVTGKRSGFTTVSSTSASRRVY